MLEGDLALRTWARRFCGYAGGTPPGGTSSKGRPPQPFETFSYDNALRMAQIEDFNILGYTSVLPKELKLKDIEELKPFFFKHGAVLETIMAGVGIEYSPGPAPSNHSFRTHGRYSVHSSDEAVRAAASCIGTITNAYTKDGINVGGFAAEFVAIYPDTASGKGEERAREDAIEQLMESTEHELEIRGLVKREDTRLFVYPVDYVEVSETEKCGYTLNALGFIGFDFFTAP